MEPQGADLIAFDGLAFAVREDIYAAHRKVWTRIAQPGAWLTGAERVAVAAETRAAASCQRCAHAREALSPNDVSGEHARAAQGIDLLSDVEADTIHRITSDPGRLTKTWFEKTQASGIAATRYVEMLGVAVAVVSIDSVCRGLGVPPHPLPAPVAGSPSKQRPQPLEEIGAWVPVIPAGAASGEYADLWGRQTANVIRAMSLVPDAVRDLQTLSAAHYLPMDKVANPGVGRTLDRSQIELIAGRVSALNECFY